MSGFSNANIFNNTRIVALVLTLSQTFSLHNYAIRVLMCPGGG